MSEIQILALNSSELSPGFQIQRALPQRGLRRIGAWSFLDHIGPVELSPSVGMKVRSHPHIGLSTFTWMIQGEIAHHDSLGSDEVIRAGEVNLMTAGNGIAHTETSLGDRGTLHAAQLWIALPKAVHAMPPAFEHYEHLPVLSGEDLIETILIGSWQGVTSPVSAHTPIVGVDWQFQQNTHKTIPLNPNFEYGILPMIGDLEIQGKPVKNGELAYLPVGANQLDINAPASTRALLIGGEPLQEDLILWWNLIARTQTEIEQARTDWEQQSTRFGDLQVLGDWLHAPDITGKLLASGPNHRIE